LSNTSQLTFWHGEPQINPNLDTEFIGSYYMLFYKKAEYTGHTDENEIPMLDYHGHIGLQYNPIAISQWGLGNYNIWYKYKSANDRDINSKLFYTLILSSKTNFFNSD